METLQIQDVNTTFSRFKLLFETTLSKHAPLKIMSRKQQRMHRKPWISKGILKSIKTKNKLFSKSQNLDITYSNCGECMITLSLPRSGACNLAILNCAPVFAPRLLRCACGLGMQYCQVFF